MRKRDEDGSLKIFLTYKTMEIAVVVPASQLAGDLTSTKKMIP